MAFDLEAHRARAKSAWDNRAQALPELEEVYRWLMPYRLPKQQGAAGGESRTSHLFDMTGMASTFRGAGQLHQDLFPPGQPVFEMAPGPLSRLLGRAGDDARAALIAMERECQAVTESVNPFFMTGSFSMASAEFCLDLFAGDAVLLPLAGDEDCPVEFVCIPAHQCAPQGNGGPGVSALFWKKAMKRRDVRAQWPKGAFPKEFVDLEKEKPDDEIDVEQNFVREDGAAGVKWKLYVLVPGSTTPVVEEGYKAQPFVYERFYRVPGEDGGRGPAQLALATVKTLNKALELMLKAAAIQLFGIWGYRPGGTFNPNMARMAPGQFWAMGSTGGVMGPDVQRLDVSAGKLDVGAMITQELRTQLQQVLHDENLPQGGLTPKSAAEVMARMARVKANYVGAFARLIHGIVPVLVPRVIEILHGKSLLTTKLKIDQLLVRCEVTSPLAKAMKAEKWQHVVETIQMIAMIGGPNAIDDYFNLDDMLPDMIRDLGVKSKYVRTLQEMTEHRADKSKASASAALSQAVLDKPDKFKEALAPVEADVGR